MKPDFSGTLAAAETKAIATGDPRYLRQVELDDAVRRLTALQRAHQQSVRNRDRQVRRLERAIPAKQSQIDQLAPAAEAAAAHRDRPPRLTIGADTFADRPAAAAALTTACRNTYVAGKDRGASRHEPIGACINGIEILGARDLTDNVLLLRLAVSSRTTELNPSELFADSSPPGAPTSSSKQLGLLRRVENLYTALPEDRRRLQLQQQHQQSELDDLLANPPGHFEQAGMLAAQPRCLT